MNVLIIGSGGREHALTWKVSKSPRISKIFSAPGNAGISCIDIAELIDINDSDIDKLLDFALKNKIDLTIVGPEVPLVNGIVDVFCEHGLKIFGPNKKCAELEGSKAFAKAFMHKYSIPTAKYQEFTDYDTAIANIDAFGYPLVIKADGLAAGKGVIIVNNKEEAIKTIKMMLLDNKFGSAGKKIILEEYLEGIEASIICFVDGKTIKPMESAKDYKKVNDHDLGLNTGGMGSYSPSKTYSKEIEDIVKISILDPLLYGLQQEKMDYKGVIFIGIMISNDKKINVLEFNVRFGDPETQVLLPRLENDLIDVIELVLENRLEDTELKWSKNHALCIVTVSGGYPQSYENGKEISGLNTIEEGLVFHAGTKAIDNSIVTNGGRVLGIVALDENLQRAQERAYRYVSNISYENMYYRNDIGC